MHQRIRGSFQIVLATILGAVLCACPKPQPNTGTLIVTIRPAAAVDAGAQWQLDGGAWQDSAVPMGAIPAGAHIVTFKDRGGWAAPAPENVTIVKGQTFQLERVYQKRYALAMAALGQGSVEPAAGTHLYAVGSQITLLATPAAGWDFERWEGDLGSLDNPDTVTMNADKAVMAVFVRIGYALEVRVEGLGSVVPDQGVHVYPEGEVLNLAATPASGWRFDHWSGALSGTNGAAALTMDADKEVTAHFVYAPPSFNLSLNSNPAAGGTVGLYPAGGVYTMDTTVTLNAVPAPNYRFTGWTGALNSAANPASVVMDANKTVTANFAFEPDQFTLSVLSTPEEGGSVLSDPAEGPYDNGSVVTLTATPAANHRFVGWEGALSGEANPATVTMDSDKVVLARFEYDPTLVTLTVSPVPGDAGSIVMSPPGGSYLPGTEIVLAAVPAEGYRFDRWEGGLTGSENPAAVTVLDDMIIQAQFVALQPSVVIGVAAQPPQGGYVTLDPPGGRYLLNEQVEMLANAAANYTFVRWEGSVTGADNPVDVAMDADKAVTAVFDWEMEFPDANLDAVVRLALGLQPAERMMASQLAALTELNAAGLGIQNLEGLQFCVNLGQADLSYNLFGDLWPLVNNPGFQSGAALNITGCPIGWWTCDAMDRLRGRGATIFSQDVCSDKEFVSLHDYWPMAVGNAWPMDRMSCMLYALICCGPTTVGDMSVTDRFVVNNCEVWKTVTPVMDYLGATSEVVNFWAFVDGWLCYGEEDAPLAYLPELHHGLYQMFPERLALGETFSLAGILNLDVQQGPLSSFVDIAGSPYGDLDDALDLGVFVLGRCLGPIAGCGGVDEATIVGPCGPGK